MSLSKPKHKFKAEADGDVITFYVDSRTVVSRKATDQDKLEYPDLFKKKRGRPRKVDDDQGNTESSPE